MHATDLDTDINCPGCDGSGAPHKNDPARSACPICGGSGTFNRYQDAKSGHVVVGPVNYYEHRGSIVVERRARMPVEDDEIGGFDGRFGTFKPSNPVQEYQQDMLDQLGNNPLGTNTNTNDEYEMPDEPPYNGKKYDPAAFSSGAFPSSDMTPAEVVEWARGRGDSPAADMFETTFKEVGLL